MPKWHSARFIILTLFLATFLFVAGCSDDDETTPTDAGGEDFIATLGDIFIQTSPSTVDVGWVLHLPDGSTVNGLNQELLAAQPNGVYTMVWPDIPGYQGPASYVVSDTLDGTNNLVFAAIYDVEPGTCLIRLDPYDLMADWTLSLNSNIDYEVTGTGSGIVLDLPPGTYTLTVEAPEGLASAPTFGSLSTRLPMILEPAPFTTVADTVVAIHPVPDGENASWSLVGPEVIELDQTSGEIFAAEGTGRQIINLPIVQEREIAERVVNDTTATGQDTSYTVIDTTIFDVPVPGDYTVTWQSLDDYNTPDPLTWTLEDGASPEHVFVGEYEALDGTITVSATQGGQALPWSLIDPAGTVHWFSGDQVLEGAPVGIYMVQGRPVDGFSAMAAVAETLTTNSSIEFAVSAAPVIEIATMPQGVDASWHLTGPDAYTLDGVGPMVVEGLADGCYDLTWDDLEGWTAPAAANVCIDENGGALISGEYTRDAGSLYVKVQPAGLDASWSITGPDGFTAEGSGQAAISIGTAGEYEITWGQVEGYLLPVPETFTYSGEGGMEMGTFYLESLGLSAIPAGSFQQGSSFAESCRNGYEISHSVSMTQPFIIQTTEVTNYQYMALAQWAYDRGYVRVDRFGIFDNLGETPVPLLDLDDSDVEITFADGVFSCFNPHHPVREVSWYGAAAFCNWLSMYRGLTPAYDHDSWECGFNHPTDALGFRLPTEAEWEYACEAGSSGAYANYIPIRQGTYDCYSSTLSNISWYGISSGGETHEVGLLDSNGWGLYDMHGNVQEWTNDWFQVDYYLPLYAPSQDPRGPLEGDEKVIRGGHYHSSADGVRSAFRWSGEPGNAGFDTGFRICISDHR